MEFSEFIGTAQLAALDTFLKGWLNAAQIDVLGQFYFGMIGTKIKEYGIGYSKFIKERNAELADEYGIIMGMSHHEPCLRQGEEYKYLRGRILFTEMPGISEQTERELQNSGKMD